MILRRLLLASLVLYCASLIGCATPDVMCQMKTQYGAEVAMAKTGNVRLAWRFEAEQKPGFYGVADCTKGDDPLCLLRLKGSPPKFDDVCGLARLGHEVAHALGAMHD